MSEIRTVGLVGTGVIGAGWATRVLARGLDVIAWDPAPDAEQKLRTSVDHAWPVVQEMGLFPGASRDRLQVVARLESVLERADFVQESAPERIELKIELHTRIDAATPEHVPIASSTSGLLPSEFQANCVHPERVFVAHPFNPVYLLPLVELIGGGRTDLATLDRAKTFYSDLGMHPLRVRKEVPGFLADRLQEAMWREVLHLVNEGVATTEELDAAISYGPGLRLAIWGTCLNFHLAGGQGGMRQMLEHFDPSLFPWSKLEPPPLSSELVESMVKGCEEQAAGRSIRDLERERDRALLDILGSLASQNVGAGKLFNEHRRRIAGLD